MEESKLPLLEPETLSSSSSNSSSLSETDNQPCTSICTTFFSSLPACREISLCCKNKSSFKSILLVLLVIQGSSAILVGRFTRSSVPEDDLYEISHLVFVIECVKLLLSIIAECIVTRGRILESVHEHIVKRPLDSCKVLVPAILYVIQNSLVYIALSNLSAPVFISLQQGKLIATALVSVGMLQRSYSLKQWVCLVVLAMGVAVIALDENSGSSSQESTGSEDETDTEPEQFFFVGILAVTGACFSSAFAGVYFEKVLAPEKATTKICNQSCTVKPMGASNNTDVIKPHVQETTPVGPSLWMRNLQLSFFSIIFCLLQGLLDWKMAIEVYNMEFDDDVAASSSSAIDEEAAEAKPYFHGFTTWVWVLVFLQAGGGLLVAAVMKWADNVLKGLAMGIGVVVASVVSTLLFHLQLSQQFGVGAFIICFSVYTFSNDFPLSSLCLPRTTKPTWTSTQG